MALRCEVVDLIGLHPLNDMCQTSRVGHIPVMQKELNAFFMRVPIQMIDTRGVK